MSPVRTRSLALFIFCRRSSGVERFLGKEEVGSSNLLAGSTSNLFVALISPKHLNTFNDYLLIIKVFFVPILFIHFYRNTIVLTSNFYHVMIINVKKYLKPRPISHS